jgi:hypothetical protein
MLAVPGLSLSYRQDLHQNNPGRNEAEEATIMTLLIGGIVTAFVGFVGFILCFGDFLVLLKGLIPILLLAGGCLAAYIGFDDLQDKLEHERQRQEEAVNKAQEEAELAQVKAEQYREELEKLKESVRNKA